MDFETAHLISIPRLFMIRRTISLILSIALFLPLVSHAQLNPTLLSGPISNSSDILQFKISPDSQRIVYWGDQDTVGTNELYSVKLDGTGRVKLNLPIAVTEDVDDNFLISADSQRVVFRVLGSPDRLYSVPIEGGNAVQLDTSVLVDGPLHGTQAFEITADSSKVVFTADLVTRSSTELFVVAIGGGVAPTQLAPTFPGPAPFGRPAFRISADSSQVVFRASLSFSSPHELFSVPITGGAHVKLNDPLAVNGEIEAVDGYFITADSTRVIYLAEQDLPTSQELYSVPIAGGSPVKLNAVLDFNTDVVTYVVSPDSQTVVYQARLNGNTLTHFYGVSTTGGASTQLSADPVAGGGLSFLGGKGPNAQMLITPDSSKLVYWARIDDADTRELYSVALGGGASTRLNGALVAGGNVNALLSENNSFSRGYALSADGNRVYYFADQEVDGELHLYSVPVAGGAATRLTTTPLQSAIPPLLLEGSDSKNIIYLSDVDLDNAIEARGVRATGNPLADNFLFADIASFFIGSPDRQLRAALSGDAQTLVFLDKVSALPDALQLFAIGGTGDSDDDGVFDALDNCIDNLNTNQANNDNDALGDVCDPDDDNDMVDDINDAFPFDPSESVDTDGDMIGDNQDTNDDNDMHLDVNDNCPLIVNDDQLDTDSDNEGDACDADDDNDGVADGVDINSLNPTLCRDFDVDSCDDCSIGVDGFGPLDDFDVSNDGLDTNSDGQCNVSDPDDDGDSVLDNVDNCPLTVNPGQEDNNGFEDGMGEGDACEVRPDLCIPIKAKNRAIVQICF